MTTPNTTLAVPVVPHDGGLLSLTLDLTITKVAESRIEEIKAVTPQKAPELLATFNEAYLKLTEMIAILIYEESRAEKQVSLVRSRLLIDVIPGIVKEKGLPSSADIRNAIVEANEEYQTAQDKLDFIHACIEHLKGKLKAMEMAFSSVKKIIDGANYNMVRAAGKKHLDGILDEDAPVGGTVRPLFGKAR
jgi:hypothetical protein